MERVIETSTRQWNGRDCGATSEHIHCVCSIFEMEVEGVGLWQNCQIVFGGNVQRQRPIRKHFSRARNMSRSHVGSTHHAAFFGSSNFLGSESLDAHMLILGPWKSSRPLSSVLLSICLGVGTIILTLNKRVAKDIRRSNAPKAPIDLETKRRRRETERDTALYNSTNLLRRHRPFRE